MNNKEKVDILNRIRAAYESDGQMKGIPINEESVCNIYKDFGKKTISSTCGNFEFKKLKNGRLRATFKKSIIFNFKNVKRKFVYL